MADGGEAQVIATVTAPVTSGDVCRGLRAAGVVRGNVIIVHSSLSRLGWVVGGAHAVVLGLLDAVGPDGTIVMPAHTGIGDPSRWQHPPVPEAWWPTIRAEWPAFDTRLTPLRAMGAVVDCFRRLPGVRHSGHPATGFVAHGPLAGDVTARHPLEQSLGDDSPLGRLHDLDAGVVLLGVGHANNTSLHLAEHRATWPGKANRTEGAPLLVDGVRRWVTYADLDHDASDFEALADAFLAAGGTERRAPVGAGEVRACRMREIVDFATGWISTARAEAPVRSS